MDCGNVEVVEALGASNAAQQRHHDGARGGQLVDGVDVAAVVEAAPEDAPAEKRAVLVAHVGHRHQLLVLDVGGGVRRAAPARPVQAAVEHVAPAVAAVALAAGVALSGVINYAPEPGIHRCAYVSLRVPTSVPHIHLTCIKKHFPSSQHSWGVKNDRFEPNLLPHPHF